MLNYQRVPIYTNACRRGPQLASFHTKPSTTPEEPPSVTEPSRKIWSSKVGCRGPGRIFAMKIGILLGKHGENMGKIAKVHQSSQFLLQLRNTYIIIPFNCWLNILMDHIFLLRLSFAFNKNYVDQKNTFSFFKLETKTLLMAKSHFPIFPGEIPMFPV